MRQIKRLVWCVVVSLFFYAVLPGLSQAAEYLYLAKPNGTVTGIPVDDNTALVGMATWCPHCKNFTAFLKDSALAPYLKRKRFVFVLGNEWPKIGRVVKAQVEADVQAGKMAASQLESVYRQRLSTLQQKAGHGMVYNPSVLSTLPGPYYFITPESQKHSNIRLQFFPSCYSTQSKAFDLNAMAWIDQHANIPENLLMQKARQYKLTSE